MLIIFLLQVVSGSITTLTTANAATAVSSEAAPGIEITIAFAYGGEIYLTDFAADPINLTHSVGYETNPTWSPDGQSLAFLAGESEAETGDLHVTVLDLATGKIRQLNDVPFTTETKLAWSPDGAHIATTAGTIFMMDAATGAARSLVSDCGSCNLNWLPDSSGLIFQNLDELYRIDTAGEQLQPIMPVSDPISAFEPILAPVTGEVVFISTVGDKSGLFAIDLDDTPIQPRLLFDNSRYFSYPYAWSPDGQYVAFNLSANDPADTSLAGGSNLYVINRDGTDMRLMSGDAIDALVGWSNDSQHILYYAGVPGDADGSYYAVNIHDGAQTRLSGDNLDLMCAYSGCRSIVVRPG
jgi:Tol biopolymer transport system component